MSYRKKKINNIYSPLTRAFFVLVARVCSSSGVRSCALGGACQGMSDSQGSQEKRSSCAAQSVCAPISSRVRYAILLRRLPLHICLLASLRCSSRLLSLCARTSHPAVARVYARLRLRVDTASRSPSRAPFLWPAPLRLAGVSPMIKPPTPKSLGAFLGHSYFSSAAINDVLLLLVCRLLALPLAVTLANAKVPSTGVHALRWG